jgi:VanZ family protein
MNRHGMPLRRAVRLKKGGVIRDSHGFASGRQIGDSPWMKLSHPLLHAARIAVGILFYPALATVIWGELAGPEPQLLGFLEDFNDKILHFFAYFALAAMAAAACKERRSMLFASIGLMLLGAILEVLQGFMRRDMSFYDEVANVAGVLVGGIASRAVVEILRQRVA